MGTNLSLLAIIRKRADIAGEVEALSARCHQLRVNLVHLDAAIRIMDPDAEPELIRPRKPSRRGCDWFGRQELLRLALEGVRKAERPLSTVEIARGVMLCKGIVVDDAIALRRVAGMVKGVLHRQDGRTVERAGSGRDVGWRIAN